MCQLVDRGHSSLWISAGVSDHQFDRSSSDPAGDIDVVHSLLEPSEQVLARLDPAGTAQRHESADPDRCSNALHEPRA